MAKSCIKREILTGEASKSDVVLTKRLGNNLKAINNLLVYGEDKSSLGFWRREVEDGGAGFCNLIIIEGNLPIVDSK